MQDFYRHRYKKLMLVPLALLIPMLFLAFVSPGIQPGIDLTGGNVLIVRSQTPLVESKIYDILRNEFELHELKVSTISSPTGYGAWIQYTNDPVVANIDDLVSKASASIDDEQASLGYSKQALSLMKAPPKDYPNAKVALLAAQDELAVFKENFSKKLEDALVKGLSLGENAEFQKREISATLGSAVVGSSAFIAILSFALIVGVIFIAFRQFVPSVAIIEAMIFDVLAGLTGMALLHIPLSLTTIPALLMLVGYSVDTDIMLTSRMLRSKASTAGERATDSLTTGITMTMTTIMALLSMAAISYFGQIEVIYEIAVILLFGLAGDIIATWLMNAPILLWWMESKEKKQVVSA